MDIIIHVPGYFFLSKKRMSSLHHDYKFLELLTDKWTICSFDQALSKFDKKSDLSSTNYGISYFLYVQIIDIHIF